MNCIQLATMDKKNPMEHSNDEAEINEIATVQKQK